ncbi:hypothetical protein IscW_ISCW007694 [Ixodes scapularis]|uniref:Uncharacterized protein n=1 Tax=Ixodes scapularis TaxID=6945 RepID=B7PU77_IXOSC|nr:hypothetical protein IscW_ISCW007694 [Ixodes scapularis]|eukprot:XP_002405605.1 hypothetical protein IscW_ISCW007694 [Ixodes scapularis]
MYKICFINRDIKNEHLSTTCWFLIHKHIACMHEHYFRDTDPPTSEHLQCVEHHLT